MLNQPPAPNGFDFNAPAPLDVTTSCRSSRMRVPASGGHASVAGGTKWLCWCLGGLGDPAHVVCNVMPLHPLKPFDRLTDQNHKVRFHSYVFRLVHGSRCKTARGVCAESCTRFFEHEINSSSCSIETLLQRSRKLARTRGSQAVDESRVTRDRHTLLILFLHVQLELASIAAEQRACLIQAWHLWISCHL
jgi:hypothetical protein